jgi:hypothetical protein
LGDFQDLSAVRLQIGERDRTIGCTEVDTETNTLAHG